MDTPVYPTRIPLEQALQIVATHAARQRLPVERLPLADARGCVLAEDIRSPHADGSTVAGDAALKSGTVLGATELAMLAASGATRVDVRRSPRVALVAIHNVSEPAGRPPVPGGIQDIDAATLAALARTADTRVVARTHVHDDPEAVRAAMLDAAIDADIVVTRGGESAAEADRLTRVLTEIGEIHFHQVRSQPGASVLFGQIGACLYFGLPGDLVAAAVSFRVFVGFAVRAMLGITQVPEPVRARLAEDICKRHPYAEFVRCTLHADADGVQWASPRPRQGPATPRDAAATDLLALLPEDKSDYRRGDVVTFWPA